MLTNLRIRLADLIWPAVLAAVASGLAVLVALVSPEKGSLVLALGFTGITMALLAQTL